ncbi:hypothetical protein AC1031_010177 [Aphanomyces cochlioides]|nr:hypothetical protein AC1031_010177 [Aphanomyces cochlioides]
MEKQKISEHQSEQVDDAEQDANSFGSIKRLAFHDIPTYEQLERKMKNQRTGRAGYSKPRSRKHRYKNNRRSVRNSKRACYCRVITSSKLSDYHIAVKEEQAASSPGPRHEMEVCDESFDLVQLEVDLGISIDGADGMSGSAGAVVHDVNNGQNAECAIDLAEDVLDRVIEISDVEDAFSLDDGEVSETGPGGLKDTQWFCTDGKDRQVEHCF